jgi:HK97 family phage major capsid protein
MAIKIRRAVNGLAEAVSDSDEHELAFLVEPTVLDRVAVEASLETPMTPAQRRATMASRKTQIEGSQEQDFRDYLRFGKNGIDESRSQTTVTTGGGYLVPEQFSATFNSNLKQYDQIFDVATKVVTDKGGPFQYPMDDDSGQSAAVVLENQGSATNVDVVFANLALPKCPNWRTGMIRSPVELAQDSAFDLGTLLAAVFAKRFARGCGSAFVTALLAAADNAVVSAAPTALVVDEVLSLVAAVDPAYMLSGTFMMNPSTLLFLQKLKASTGGSYLVEAKRDAEGYPTLFGYRVYLSPSYPTIAANAKVISFGDHTRFIRREVRNSLAIKTLVERFAEYGQVGYEAHWQVQGDLAKPTVGPLPVRLLVCHS